MSRTLARVTGRFVFLCELFDGDESALLESASEVWHLLFHEANDARSDGVKSVVLAAADARTWVNCGTALTDQDFTGEHFGAIAALDAQTLSPGVTSISCRALGFFVCHRIK